MKPLPVLFVVWGIFFALVKAQFPAFSSAQNIYLDNSSISQIEPVLFEEYINLLCTIYNGKVYLLTGIEPAPLCDKQDNEYLRILLFFLLLKPMKDIVEAIMNGSSPDPVEPTSTSTLPPVTPAIG